jgi:hypothetical protein
MALRCAVAFPPEQRVGDKRSSLSRALCAMTESTSSVEFHFNNINHFIIRPVIVTVVCVQGKQNARRGHRCKEDRGT